MKPLSLKNSSTGGFWVIEIEDLEYQKRRQHLMKGGRLLNLSMQIDDAKPYKIEQTAIKAETEINQVKPLRAHRQQLTTQVVKVLLSKGL